MLSYVSVFGLTLPAYGLAVTISWLLGGYVAVRIAKQHKLDENDTILILIYSTIIGFIGAKILFLITVLPQVIYLLHNDPNLFFENLINSGFVYYGGVIGGIFGAWLCSKIHKIKLLPHISSIIVALPLAHAIGRVGCFLVGCCYGLENHDFGIIYHASPVAPNNIPLLPVQLYESFFNLILFAVLYRISKRAKSYDSTILVYVYSYAVIRFFLEFLRFDSSRGNIAGLYTSQWISVGLVICCLLYQFLLPRLFLRRNNTDK